MGNFYQLILFITYGVPAVKAFFNPFFLHWYPKYSSELMFNIYSESKEPHCHSLQPAPAKIRFAYECCSDPPSLDVFCRRLETCTTSSWWASGVRRRWRCLMMTWRTLSIARTQKTQVCACVYVFIVQNVCLCNRPCADHNSQRMSTESFKKNRGRQLCLTGMTGIIPQASDYSTIVKNISRTSRCWNQSYYTHLMLNMSTNYIHQVHPHEYRGTSDVL